MTLTYLKRFTFLLAWLCQGCATVAPWEKAGLAEPFMQFKQLRPNQKFLIHSVITLEQAEGGSGRTGGGCGCR